ncbi:MAG: acyl-CoA thioesterase [Methyloligellaceae bacterium]
MNNTWQNLTIDDFPHQTMEQVRFSDTDSVGHVNNVAFAAYLETGRVSLTHESGVREQLKGTGTHFVIAQLNLSYRGEMSWPGKVRIGTGITKTGRSSVTMVQAMYQGDLCTSTAEAVLVLMDMTSRKSTPLPENIIPLFQKLIISPA